MNNKHILWADDEIHLLKPHIIFMEDKGYKVTPVNSGEDAIIECKKSDIDLILIDEMMTGLNGIETINIIKSNNPEIPIIMVTKNEEEWLMEEAISIHIANFLTKPVNPSQILIACKTVLEQNILEKDKIIKDFMNFNQKALLDFQNINNFSDWVLIFEDLTKWSIALENIDDPSIKDIYIDLKKNLNSLFSKYVVNNYKDWISGNTSKPILSCDVFDNSIKPLLKKNKKTVFIIIDCFRLDQWKVISGLFYDKFRIKEDTHFSIIPTATPFARNSIFSGLYPIDIKYKYPDIWKKMFVDKKMNSYEDILFEKQLKDKGFIDKQHSYVKISNYKEGKKFLNKINDYKSNDILNIVVNFVDILGHSRSESNILKELIPNESAYRQAIYNWFDKSWLKEAINIFYNWEVDIVITSDHGNTIVDKPIEVKADSKASDGVRYKYGRNLKSKTKNILKIEDPKQYRLPALDVNTQYIITKDSYYFVYKNNYHHYANIYRNSFQHGGISLDEVIIPLIHLKRKD